jgi:SprT-like family
MATRVHSATPTVEQYQKYQAAWGWFNEQLFDETLNPCLLNFSRHRGALGFFHPRRWHKGKAAIHEISLNPNHLTRPLAEVMATLVHEMCHQWQFDHGTPPRKAYHDIEWARKMDEVGLVPSNTGQPGGKRTGQKMTHYISEAGKFADAMEKMPLEYQLPWLGEEAEATPKVKTQKRMRLTCPGCEMHVWVAVEDMERSVFCGDCGETYLNREELKERRNDEVDN